MPAALSTNPVSLPEPDRPIRVLFLADHLGHPSGRVHGGTTYFVNVLPALQRAGVELTACFMAARHPAADRLEAAGVRPLFLGRAKWDPRAVVDVLRLARRTDPEVVHLHSEKSLLFGRVIARLRSIPAVVHLHDAIRLRPGTRLAQRLLARRTHTALIISEALRPYALAEHRLPPDRVRLLHYGMDLTPFTDPAPGARSAVRQELGIGDKAPVLAVVGRVVSEKGQAELIRAMPRVLAEHPRAKLVVVGDGADRGRCEGLARELSLRDAVVFTGQRRDVPSVLAAVDVVAMPSLWEEGFGFAALEAAAAGRPVVAFRVGGIPTVVLDGKTGVLVEKGNRDELAGAIAALLGDPERREQLGAAGREHARTFALDRHVDRLLAVYHRAIDGTDLPPTSANSAHAAEPGVVMAP